MKTIVIISVILFSFSFCKSDKSILGKWNLCYIDYDSDTIGAEYTYYLLTAKQMSNSLIIIDDTSLNFYDKNGALLQNNNYTLYPNNQITIFNNKKKEVKGHYSFKSKDSLIINIGKYSYILNK